MPRVVVFAPPEVVGALRSHPHAIAADGGAASEIDFVADDDPRLRAPTEAARLLSSHVASTLVRVEHLSGAAGLEAVERWCDSLQGAFDRMAQTRWNEFRVCLIVCWTGEGPSAEVLQRLERFRTCKGDSADRLATALGDGIRRIYTIGPRLHDWKGSGHGLFDAAEAWPIMVDRLLLKLSIDDRIARDGQRGLYAWRFTELPAPWQLEGWRALHGEVLDHLWPPPPDDAASPWPRAIRLASGREALDDRDGTSGSPPIALSFTAPPGSLVEAIREEVTTTALRDALSKASRGVGGLSPLADQARRSIEDLWAAVAQEPGRLGRLSDARASKREEPARLVRDQFSRVETHLLGVESFERTAADLEQAAQQIDEARNAWTGVWLRLLGGAAIAMVIAYAIYGLVRPVSSSAVLALQSATFVATAIAAVAGMVAGALGPWWIERSRGNAATARLQQGAESAHEQLAVLRKSLLETIRQAGEIREACWERSTAARIRILGERASELRDRARAAVSGRPAATAPVSSSSDHHGSEFLQAVRIETPASADLAGLPGEERTRLVDGGRKTTHDTLRGQWSALLERCDPRRQGLLPAAEVEPALREALRASRFAGEQEILREGLDHLLKSPHRDEFLDAIASDFERRFPDTADSPLLSVQTGVLASGKEAHEGTARTRTAFTPAERGESALIRWVADSRPHLRPHAFHELPRCFPPALLALLLEQVEISCQPDKDGRIRFMIGAPLR